MDKFAFIYLLFILFNFFVMLLKYRRKYKTRTRSDFGLTNKTQQKEIMKDA
jgi:hypothetical protein